MIMNGQAGYNGSLKNKLMMHRDNEFQDEKNNLEQFVLRFKKWQ